jgi:hypothetical protein
VKRQLRAALAERNSQVQRTNELTQQLQDKKRQLFGAIQVTAPPIGWLAGPSPRLRSLAPYLFAWVRQVAPRCKTVFPSTAPARPRQEREGLRQQVRALEEKCRDFQEALQCRMCRAVRGCVLGRGGDPVSG